MSEPRYREIAEKLHAASGNTLDTNALENALRIVASETAANEPEHTELAEYDSTAARDFTVTWSITEKATSHREAALSIWTTIFGRSEFPGPDECCVFTVSDGHTTTEIDLSDES